MSLPAYQLQPCDTFTQTFAQNGWSDKLLEVVGVSWQCSTGSTGDAPGITLQVEVQETDPSIYEWSPAEELGTYDVPVNFDRKLRRSNGADRERERHINIRIFLWEILVASG